MTVPPAHRRVGAGEDEPAQPGFGDLPGCPVQRQQLSRGHPHIVPLLSAGQQDELLWYTMPYIEGESLRAAIERKRKFSARDVMRILHDVTEEVTATRSLRENDARAWRVLQSIADAVIVTDGLARDSEQPTV